MAMWVAAVNFRLDFRFSVSFLSEEHPRDVYCHTFYCRSPPDNLADLRSTSTFYEFS